MSLPAAILGLSMPELSLLFFLGLFIALLAWLFVFRRRGWDAESRIPLEERPVEERLPGDRVGRERPADAKRASDHGDDSHA